MLCPYLGRRSPAKSFAWSVVESCGHGGEFISVPTCKVCALGKVLAKQTVGIFIAAALPRALRVAEVDFETSVDPKLGHAVPSRRPDPRSGSGANVTEDP